MGTVSSLSVWPKGKKKCLRDLRVIALQWEDMLAETKRAVADVEKRKQAELERGRAAHRTRNDAGLRCAARAVVLLDKELGRLAARERHQQGSYNQIQEAANMLLEAETLMRTARAYRAAGLHSKKLEELERRAAEIDNVSGIMSELFNEREDESAERVEEDTKSDDARIGDVMLAIRESATDIDFHEVLEGTDDVQGQGQGRGQRRHKHRSRDRDETTTTPRV